MGERESTEPGRAHTPKVAPTGPTSLAAFIGGRATGPRLNKHTPQQDAHDPSQFQQRTITAPHPVFGSGGVAMPGMAARGRTKSEVASPPAPKPGAFQQPAKEPTVAPSRQDAITPSRTRITEDRRPASPEKRSPVPTNQTVPSWQRTQNAVTPKSASPAPPKESSVAKPPPSPRPTSYNAVSGDYLAAKSMPTPGRHSPAKQSSQSTPPRTSSVSPLPRTPVQQHAVSTSPPKTHFSSASPGLAKPIQPTPKASLSPQLPTSSPTFLRASPTKDPTPSISRLQGRGFVQNMVRASTQLQAASQSSGSTSVTATPEKDKATSRKASVLDRWQFDGSSPAPIIAPKPVPLRKSRTVDPSLSSQSTSPVPTPFNPAAGTSVKRDSLERGLRSVPSLPSLAHAATPDKVPRPTSAKNEISGYSSPGPQKRGLGSSTTMISYMKPLKTGDNPPTSAPPSRPSSRASRTSRSRPASPDVDELGIRVRSRSRSVAGDMEARPAGSPVPAAGGKSLSHVRSFR